MLKAATLVSLAAPLAAVVAAACVRSDAREGPGSRPEASRTGAMATVEPKSGSTAFGSVLFTPRTDGRVFVSISLAGLDEGTHLVVVHENGDCSAKDASSAGAACRELAQVEANAEGAAVLRSALEGLGTLGGSAAIIGRSVVLYALGGRRTSEPARRVGCGVIRPCAGPAPPP